MSPSISVPDQCDRGTGARKTIAFIVNYVDFTSGGYESQFREVFHDRCRELDLKLLVISGSSLKASDISDHHTMYRCPAYLGCPIRAAEVPRSADRLDLLPCPEVSSSGTYTRWKLPSLLDH